MLAWTPTIGATEYWLDVGTAPFVGNIVAGPVGTLTSKQVTGLPLDGSTVYATLYTKVNGSYQDGSGVYLRSSFTYTAMKAGVIIAPAANSALGGSTVTFIWTAAPGATEYWLDVGTSQFVGNIFGGSVGNVTSRPVVGLPMDGSTVYASLYTRINGRYQDITGAYLRTSATYLAMRIATIVSPAPSSTLAASTVTFNWTAAPGATDYWLDVGTAPFVGNIFAGPVGNTTSKQVTGLPTDGSIVYVWLYTKISGSYQDSSGAYLRTNFAYAAAR